MYSLPPFNNQHQLSYVVSFPFTVFVLLGYSNTVSEINSFPLYVPYRSMHLPLINPSCPCFQYKKIFFEKASSLNRRWKFSIPKCSLYRDKTEETSTKILRVILPFKSWFRPCHPGWSHLDHFRHKWQRPEVSGSSMYTYPQLSVHMDSIRRFRDNVAHMKM